MRSSKKVNSVLFFVCLLVSPLTDLIYLPTFSDFPLDFLPYPHRQRRQIVVLEDTGQPLVARWLGTEEPGGFLRIAGCRETLA